jgi:hypothetical protein
VSPVKYELGLYFPEDGILHGHSSMTGYKGHAFRKLMSLLVASEHRPEHDNTTASNIMLNSIIQLMEYSMCFRLHNGILQHRCVLVQLARISDSVCHEPPAICKGDYRYRWLRKSLKGSVRYRSEATVL